MRKRAMYHNATATAERVEIKRGDCSKLLDAATEWLRKRGGLFPNRRSYKQRKV